MAHYICTGGCKSVASDSGAVCQATDCSHYNQPMEECDCPDNKHFGAFDSGDSQEDEEQL